MSTIATLQIRHCTTQQYVQQGIACMYVQLFEAQLDGGNEFRDSDFVVVSFPTSGVEFTCPACCRPPMVWRQVSVRFPRAEGLLLLRLLWPLCWVPIGGDS